MNVFDHKLKNEVFFDYLYVLFQVICGINIMICKHKIILCMSSLICISQTINIGTLNHLLFFHCQNGILVYKP